MLFSRYCLQDWFFHEGEGGGMSSDNIPIYVQRVKSRIYMFPSVSYILYIYTPMFPLFNRKLTIVSAAVLSLKIKNTKIFYCLKKWDVSTFPECRAVLPGAAPAYHPPATHHLPATHPQWAESCLAYIYYTFHLSLRVEQCLRSNPIFGILWRKTVSRI